MEDHRKIYRIFQLIARLRGPFGCTKEAVARDFEVSVRTIERNLSLLTDLGFHITKEGNRFKIQQHSKDMLCHEDLIVFTLEEACAIRDALDAGRIEGPLRKSLLDKLYALTELDELSETLRINLVSHNISLIRQAIKSKQRIYLKNYHSVNSNSISNRLVEPIRFFNYYRYVLAWEVDTRQVRQFKTERIGAVEHTGKPWKNEAQHGTQRIDVFGLSGNKPQNVRLQLSNRAKHLLEEEFPDAATQISPAGDQYLYQGNVFSYEGIGRFVMGLADEINVSEPDELRDFIRNKLEKALKQQCLTQIHQQTDSPKNQPSCAGPTSAQ